MALNVNCYYFPLLWIILFAIYIYKATVFKYGNFAFGLEFGALFPWILLEFTRILIGSRGNKLEEFNTSLIFLGLSVASFFVHLFYMIWQSYV